MSYNENVGKMAEVIRAEMVQGDHGVVTMQDGWFEKTLEDTDLTMDQFKRVQDHRDLVLAGTGLALGQNGIDSFEKNKDLDTVSLEARIHRDDLGGVFHRQKDLPDGKGGMKPRHGVLTMRYVANGQQGAKGQLKKVKEHLSSEALKALNG